VLFISGYPGDVHSEKGLLEPGIELLQKPLGVDALLRTVSGILARRQG